MLKCVLARALGVLLEKPGAGACCARMGEATRSASDGTSGRLEVRRTRQPRGASARERDGVRADALFGMSDPVFAGDDLDLHEAMARYLCLWMDEEKHHLWDYYRAWRGSVREDPTGERAFASVFGETPAQANEEWLSWVRRQRFRPAAGSIGGR
jgi:hypothetical protein